MVRYGRFAALAGALGIGVLAPSAASATACEDFGATIQPPTIRDQSIRPIDLVELHDIVVDASGSSPPFRVSSDGARLVMTVRRADPAANGYCAWVIVVSAVGEARPVVIHRSFEPASDVRLSRGELRASGLPSLGTPLWSPDGRSVAFLARANGVTQLWRATSDGSRSWRVSNSPTDIVDFGWSSDGKSLTYSSRLALLVSIRAIEAEGRSGYHFDERFAPPRGPQPFAQEDAALQHFTASGETGLVRVANDGEIALLAAARRNEPARVENGLGDLATTTSPTPGMDRPRDGIAVRFSNGDETRCERPECSDTAGLWWSTDGTALYFLRREGWTRGELGMYRWQPRSGEPQRTFLTNDVLIGCQWAATHLVCGHEASTTPLRIVRLDPDTGELQPLYEPNPQTARWRFGPVERLRWVNEFGAEAFGDLVLPPDHAPGQRHPLIIVGYISRGFLRGGSGDEYPIQAFASRGYAVLSLNRPLHVGYRSGGGTSSDVVRRGAEDWMDYRSTHSALEAGIRLLETRGLIEPSAIGITGFSNGAESARWAILNSDRFAAAVISSCCMGPSSTMTLLGFRTADRFRTYGYPGVSDDQRDAWRPVALELNAQRLAIPLLIQAADTEYLSALPAMARFREASAPVDLFVFPNETHVKWQPAHRLAMYQRNLDWFDFWLRGVENSEPGRPTEYRRWRDWRSRLNNSVDQADAR